MLIAVGAKITEAAGSRIAVSKADVDMVLHRPHPRKEAAKHHIKDVRAFLTQIGVEA